MDKYLLIIFSTILFAIFFIWLFWYLRKTKRNHSKFGVNLKALGVREKLICPNCGNPLPKIRKPQNWRQALWGGATCKSCGKEFDKWMNIIN